MRVDDIKNISIIGAGLMGHGIAQAFAQAGYNVCVHSRREESIKEALQRIRTNLETLVENNILDEDGVDATITRIKGTIDFTEAARNADFVIEAIPEDLQAKKEIFGKLQEISRETVILATNTSSFSITEIGTATNREEKVVGTHFWNPPHLLRAVEIVRGANTSDETVQTTKALLTRIGKKPVVVQKDVPGQIGIRILYAMLREAISLVDNNVATPKDLDTIVKEAFGTRFAVLGLLEMADLSGLDLVLAVSSHLNKDLESSVSPSKMLVKKVRNNHLGVKTGKGFYEWDHDTVVQTIRRRDDHLLKLQRKW